MLPERRREEAMVPLLDSALGKVVWRTRDARMDPDLEPTLPYVLPAREALAAMDPDLVGARP